MQPLGTLGEATVTAISQGMAISWETTGCQRPAPEQPGNWLHPPLDPASGRYVTDGGPR